MRFIKNLPPFFHFLFILWVIVNASLPNGFDPTAYSSKDLESMAQEISFQLLTKHTGIDPLIIYEDKNIALHYVDLYRADSDSDGYLELFLTNKTEFPLLFYTEAISLNNLPSDIWWEDLVSFNSPTTRILPQSIAILEFHLLSWTLDENAITSIESFSIEGEYYSMEYPLPIERRSPLPPQAIPSQPFHTDTILLP